MLESPLFRANLDALCSITILVMINDFQTALFAAMFVQK